MKKILLTLLALGAISLAAQVPEQKIGGKSRSISWTEQVPDKPLLKVFDAAHRSNPRQNIMLSPWGIQQCFGILVGWTPKLASAQLDAVFGLNIHSRNELRNMRLALQKTQAEFNSFNAVLFDRQYTLKQPFIQDVNYFFGGKMYRLDLTRKKECAMVLNGIIKRESRNMFDNVFAPQDLANDPAMILLNILYFKADWFNPFEAHLTHKEKFMTPSASKFEAIHHSYVDMMNDEKYVPYYNDGTIHGIVLDYADDRFKMLVLTTVKMPSSLNTVTRRLAQKGLQHFLRSSSDKKPTRIKLPRLQLESRVDLKSLLKSMGLNVILDPQRTNLCMIQTPDNIYIDQVRQVVKLSLDETGTEVAAVTVALPKAEAIAPKPIKYNTFYADHPFVLVLFDNKTNAILLTAAIIHPPENK